VEAGEVAHGPQLLPGGDTVLFTLAKGATAADRWDKAQIVVHSLKSGQRKVLIDGADARYVPTGHLVYSLGNPGTLLAVPFDLKHLQITGGPVPVIEGVLRAGTGTGAANFSFSDDGSLVYVPSSASIAGAGRILALVDRSGVRKPLPIPPAYYFQPRFSPDGKQLTMSTDDGKEAAVWVYDLSGTKAMRHLTFGGANRFPLWSNDGQRIVFQSDREKDLGLFWQRADGSGTAERLTRPQEKESHEPDSWLPDGKTLIFNALAKDRGIWSISMERDSKAKVLIDLPANQSDATFSPDGHWFAYWSNESGQNTIYVQPYPPTGAKYQITTGVSVFPLWSPGGKQIFYVEYSGGFGDLVSVEVQTTPTFTFGKPTTLPIKDIIFNGGQGNPRGFDISPDGKQFVVMLPASEAESNQRATQQVYVTLHWFDELKRRVSAK
jgi:dipeptidyl aminopeptidase/acylaminoacyl peptidase